MDWKQELIDWSTANCREVHISKLGVGIEFEDGCDAFWILPGEPTSTLALTSSEDVEVADVLSEFDRINDLRKKTLHVLKHHLSEKGVSLEISRCGIWCHQARSVSGEIWVGNVLTNVCLESVSVHDVIKKWQGVYWCGKHPSERRMARLLSLEGDPAFVAPGDESEEGSDSFQSITQALALMGLCKALKNPEKLTSKEIREAAKPRGKIGQALIRLAERLPHASAACDLLEPNSLCIDFLDEGDSFRVDVKSRALAKRFRESDPNSVGNELADEYELLNGRRSKAVAAIWQAIRELQWSVDRIGLSLFGIPHRVFVGKESREVEIRIGEELTELVGKLEPEAALRQLINHDAFLTKCIQALKHPSIVTTKEDDIPKKNLKPKSLPAPVRLVTIDTTIAHQLDTRAEAAVASFDKQELLWKYTDIEFFNAETDHWLSPSLWHNLAEEQLKNEWANVTAVQILSDLGDSRAEAEARRLVEQLAESCDDYGEFVVTLVWKFRHDYPEIAKLWFGLEASNEDDLLRSQLGDPLAQRRIRFARRDDGDLEFGNEKEIRRMSPNIQEARRQDYVEWAASEHRCSPIDKRKLRTAGRMGWTDVFDALEENPYLVSGLLDIDDRFECQDEPGLLVGSDLLLIWSRYAPSEFLARIVATVANTDLVALARTASERDVEKKGLPKSNLDMAFRVYDEWSKQLETNLAIAWLRCRSADLV